MIALLLLSQGRQEIYDDVYETNILILLLT